MLKIKTLTGLAAVLAVAALPGHAQEAAATAEAVAAAVAEPAPAPEPADTGFIFNTLLFVLGGLLVMWMAAGFAMLEAGLVRSKNVAMQLTKNIALYAIAGVTFWFVGYNLLYPGDAWTIGQVVGQLFVPRWIGGEPDVATGYSAGSDFFFQLMFCATAASIVSGTLAERIKLRPFLIFTVVLTGLLYPIVASWQWGYGWLYDMGFHDFAGSTLVHGAGGAAALAGAILLGPRLGRYAADGRVVAMPGSNLALATLGAFILWLGWFGFNGASQLALGTDADANAVSVVIANTNMAASAGALTALIVTHLVYGKVDLTMVLNGALAGLVSITAGPLEPTLFGALWIGAIGGAIVVFAVPLLDKLQIDDVVGAIPVHLLAGFWGTLAVPFYSEDRNFFYQIVGFVAVAGFVFLLSALVFWILKSTMGLRPSAEDETNGLDRSELGLEAYPEFGK